MVFRTQVACVTAVLVLVASAGCTQTNKVRAIPDESVPHGLLTSTQPGSGGDSASPTFSRQDPKVYFVKPSGNLGPVSSSVQTEDRNEAIKNVLTLLMSGPDEVTTDENLRTTIPTGTQLVLERVDGGTAELSYTSPIPAGPKELPFFFGQIVLSVTSIEGVKSCVFSSNGERIRATLPGGETSDQPLTNGDYIELLQEELVSPTTSSTTEPGLDQPQG